jgi:hypothetical protein
MGAAGEGASEQPVWLAGNVGGAWRIGGTVHRTAGPWTPAVHALLEYLAPRAEHIPRVLGFDEQGREILTFLPGRVVDIDAMKERSLPLPGGCWKVQSIRLHQA